jgi:general stress protein 26
MENTLAKLYEHIDDIEIAMMTTRRADGHLQSRAMATQKRAGGADLWFVSLEGPEKVRDLTGDPHINLSYYKDRTREWISVSGIARITRDRAKIHGRTIDHRPITTPAAPPLQTAGLRTRPRTSASVSGAAP